VRSYRLFKTLGLTLAETWAVLIGIGWPQTLAPVDASAFPALLILNPQAIVESALWPVWWPPAAIPRGIARNISAGSMFRRSLTVT
jgi:hypothetical protein